MKLTMTIMTMVCALALAIPAQAQSNISAGAKIFITNMEGSLDGFIAAEILKQKIPDGYAERRSAGATLSD